MKETIPNKQLAVIHGKENLKYRIEPKKSTKGGKTIQEPSNRVLTLSTQKRSPQAAMSRLPGVPLNDMR
jgi:hypothetical protein